MVARREGGPWRLRNSNAIVWVLLASPGMWLLQAYARDNVYYGEVLHRSGVWATQLLLVTVAVTPLRRLFPAAAGPRWLLARRRHLGVACFAYAAGHVGIYLQRKADLGRILTEALEPGLAAGWVAFMLFVALAVTSNDRSVRGLGGRRWKRLHRMVYPAAALTLVHWQLTAFDPTQAWIYTGFLAVLIALRLVPRRSTSTSKLG